MIDEVGVVSTASFGEPFPFGGELLPVDGVGYLRQGSYGVPSLRWFDLDGAWLVERDTSLPEVNVDPDLDLEPLFALAPAGPQARLAYVDVTGREPQITTLWAHAVDLGEIAGGSVVHEAMADLEVRTYSCPAD